MEDHNHSRRDTHHTSQYDQSQERNEGNSGYYDRNYNTGRGGGSYDNNRNVHSHDNDYPGRYGQDKKSSGHDYERDYSASTYGNRGSSYRGGSYDGGYGNQGYGGASRSRSSDDFNRGDYRQGDRHERLYSFGGSTHEKQRAGQQSDQYANFSSPHDSATRLNEGQHRGKGPKGYKRSDERILEDINDRLADDPYVDATAVEVTIQNGEVTLTGTIDDRHNKRRAEDIVESISGVRNVENRLRVFQEEKK